MVAFTPKGGCPLKLVFIRLSEPVVRFTRSIHPQGWVPVETSWRRGPRTRPPLRVAFTPKGGCPLKLSRRRISTSAGTALVAFTPKGGCPLKHGDAMEHDWMDGHDSSIHPQGWVPVETWGAGISARIRTCCSIHPQGWVPVETRWFSGCADIVCSCV